MNWSFNQRNIIDLTKGDLLVSASAGSGKTAVLVERIINLILNHGVSIDEFLIITFTNAAATEMSERILHTIESKIDDKKKDILEEQIFLISSANIQTFHSFCFEVLKNNYYKLDLDGNIKLLKDSKRKILIDEVIEEVFTYFYELNQAEFISLVNKYGGKYSDDKLRQIVIQIYNFIQTKPNMDEFKEQIIDIYTLKDNDEIFNTLWGSILKNECINKVKFFKEYAQNFITEIDQGEKIYSVILEDIAIVDKFIDRINIGYKECSKFLHDFKFPRVPSKLGEEFDEYKDYKKKIKKILDGFKKDIFLKTDSEIKEYIKKLHDEVKTLMEIVFYFKTTFDLKKRKENFIDFNDMEHLVLKLLEDESIAESFRNKFKYIFIDEYQDTNYIQEYLINRIKSIENPNVFMVGDIKQSIYSFRGAKVDLFHDKYQRYNKVVSLNDCNTKENKILLYDNYRSRKEIIDFVNFIFKNVMVKDVSNIEYTEEEYLKYLGDYESLDQEDQCYCGEVKLGVIIRDLDESEDDEEEITTEEVDESECNLIVKYIKDLMESNKVYKIFDKELKDYRKIEYRDIVILMRNVRASSKSTLLEEILLKNNIPVYFDGGDSFFDSIEVMVILSLLKVIDNPLDDLDLLTILRSEIFNFNEHELVYLRIVDKKDFLYNNLKTICKTNMIYDQKIPINKDFDIEYDEFKNFKDKCVNFMKKIDLYRKKSLYMRIDDFIWYLYMDTNYYFYISTMNNGLEKQNNLKLIFNKAKEYRISSFSGLFNFIEYLEHSKKSGDDILVPKNISKNENVVRIMSIHKSKGLEFPVVILCNTASSFNTRNLNSTVILDDELGVGINYIDYDNNLETDSLVKVAIKSKVKKTIISEELRILYVALTRAKEKLFIIGTYKNEKVFKRIYSLEKCKSYLDFLCHSLMNHVNGEYLRNKSERNNFKLNDECDVSIDIYSHNDLLLVDNKVKKHENIDKLKNMLLNEESKNLDIIKSILNFKYQYDDVLNIPMNMSVSELLSNDSNKKVNINFKKPSFLDKDNNKIYTGIDIGNLYHLFMQNINLKNDIDIDYINSEISRMALNNILENEDLEHLNPHKILSFFNSGIGIRLKKSFLNNNKVYREFEFLMKHKVEKICNYENIRIQGIIDLFFFEDNEIILLDYKTDKMIFRNDLEIIKKYKEQLKYYQIAIEKIFKTNVKEKYIYSFELSKELRV